MWLVATELDGQPLWSPSREETGPPSARGQLRVFGGRARRLEGEKAECPRFPEGAQSSGLRLPCSLCLVLELIPPSQQPLPSVCPAAPPPTLQREGLRLR